MHACTSFIFGVRNILLESDINFSSYFGPPNLIFRFVNSSKMISLLFYEFQHKHSNCKGFYDKRCILSYQPSSECPLNLRTLPKVELHLQHSDFDNLCSITDTLVSRDMQNSILSLTGPMSSACSLGRCKEQASINIIRNAFMHSMLMLLLVFSVFTGPIVRSLH